MALRRALLSLRPNVGVARAFGTAPTGPITVADRSIDVTVVVDGIRHKLKGKVGKTLAQALAESNDPTLEAVVPEVSLKAGPDTHVTLPLRSWRSSRRWTWRTPCFSRTSRKTRTDQPNGLAGGPDEGARRHERRGGAEQTVP